MKSPIILNSVIARPEIAGACVASRASAARCYTFAKTLKPSRDARTTSSPSRISTPDPSGVCQAIVNAVVECLSVRIKSDSRNQQLWETFWKPWKKKLQGKHEEIQKQQAKLGCNSKRRITRLHLQADGQGEQPGHDPLEYPRNQICR